MTKDPFISEDVNPEPLSTLEALDDIADIVEMIVLNFGDEQGRDAYLTLSDEFQSYVETLPEDPKKRTAEQNEGFLERAKLLTDSFSPILRACPDHIRKLHDAVRQAQDAEEALQA